MGFGGPSAPKVMSAPPAEILPDSKKTKDDLLARLKRARSRSLSSTGAGMLTETATTNRPVLSDKLGV